MNHLQEAKKAISDYEAKNLNIDTLKAQAHALIAIAEQLQGVNNRLNELCDNFASYCLDLEDKS